LLGISGFPENHPLSLGFPGMHGWVWANYAIHHSDLVIGIGNRFDDRACGKFSAFAPDAKIIHLDIDPAEVGKNVRVDVPIVGDVGQHQMFAAQHYYYDHPNSFLTSGGLGTMGYALPAAIGAQLARPDRPVWCVIGDGGFQMTSQELAVAVMEKIPVKFALVN